MTARKKRRAAKKARAPVPPVSVSKVMEECVTGISLVEVAARSLDDNDAAAPERVVLKRALKAFWVVHDYLIDVPGADEGEEDEGE